MKRIVVAAALFAGSPALAADWRLSGETEDAHAYIDVESMQQTGEQARFWHMLVYRDAVRGVADRAVTYVEAKCDDGSYRNLSVLAYLGPKLVDEWTTSETNQARPDTLIGKSINTACRRIPVDEERVGDPYALSQQLFRQQGTP